MVFYSDGSVRVTRKYFFFDYDGTLAIPRTREIPQSALDTLDKLRAEGHFVALATGRLTANAVRVWAFQIFLPMAVIR